MNRVFQNEKELLMKFNTEGLSPTQARLIKTIHSLLATVITSEEEAEYFEASAGLLKKAAELIKHSNFPLENKSMSYAEQALEFALDSLNETIEADQLSNIDN
jgi:hypothetical protein